MPVISPATKYPTILGDFIIIIAISLFVFDFFHKSNTLFYTTKLFESFFEIYFVVLFLFIPLIKVLNMTASETLTFKREAVKKSLSKIVLPKDAETRICWAIGATFNVSGQTIKNYLSGNIGDYFLAEAIYKEFKSLKYTK